MHSRTPVGLLSPGIIKDNSDAGEITRMSKKRLQTGNFSDYVPLLIEGFSYSWPVVVSYMLGSKKFCQRGATLTGLFLEGKDDLSKCHYKRAIIGPPANRH